MSRTTKRTQNRCSNCGYTWFPRGKGLSKKCPQCGASSIDYHGGCLFLLLYSSLKSIATVVGLLFMLFYRSIAAVPRLFRFLGSIMDRSPDPASPSPWLKLKRRKSKTQEWWGDDTVTPKQIALLKYLELKIPNSKGEASDILDEALTKDHYSQRKSKWDGEKSLLHPDLYPPE